MGTIVWQKWQGQKSKTIEVQKLQDYGALAIDAKAALIQEMILLRLMHIVAVVEEEESAINIIRTALPGMIDGASNRDRSLSSTSGFRSCITRVRNGRMRTKRFHSHPTSCFRSQRVAPMRNCSNGSYGLSCGDYRALTSSKVHKVPSFASRNRLQFWGVRPV